MNKQDALRMKGSQKVRLVRDLRDKGLPEPPGTIGRVTAVIQHDEEYGGFVEVVVDWPVDGTNVMDPVDIEVVDPSDLSDEKPM